MVAVVLGPAKIGDAPAIANMSRVLIEAGLPWRWTPKRVAAHMKERENLVVVAKEGNDLVGFAMAQFHTEVVHLTLIGVVQSSKRHGIGRKLIAWVEDSARVAGLFRVNLELRAGNQDALRFYTAVGYKQSGRIAGYYSGIEDALQLTRDLRVTSRA